MGDKLTFNQILSCLHENFETEQEKTDKCRTWQKLLQTSYKNYKRQVAEDTEIVDFQDFSRDLFARHERALASKTNLFRHTYHQDDAYLSSLAKKTIDKFNQMATANFVFKRQSEQSADFDIVLNYYLQKVPATSGDKTNPDTIGDLLRQALKKCGAGIHLLTRNFVDEALILWRAFLEDMAIVNVMILHQKKKLDRAFLTNKTRTLHDLGFGLDNPKHVDSISKQVNVHIDDKQAKDWEMLRFSWLKDCISDKDYTSSKVRSLAGLEEYSKHYKFTSVFVHERLISDEDVKILPLADYALCLYWRLFDEELRNKLLDYFALQKMKEVEKLEKEIRLFLKSKYQERFKEFSRILAQ
ncbi:MAG: DUF5677 domain-containing protein [Bacilli bacterium]|jgi:hypothetical protein